MPALLPVTGTIVLFPARVRAGPTTNSEIVARLDGGIQVTLLGLLEDGTWALIRVDDPAATENGQIGWMALELMAVTGDLQSLPLYDSAGNRLALPEPTPTSESAAPPPNRLPTVTPTRLSLATPTATLGIGPSRPVFGTPPPAQAELPTATPTRPVPAQPAGTATGTSTDTPTSTAAGQSSPAQDRGTGIPLAGIPAPAPAPGSLIVTVAGSTVPANPLLPIPVQAADGRTFQLMLDVTRDAQVQVWSGLLGEAAGRWVPARGELLWPGTLLYVEGPLQPGSTEIRAVSVQIAGLPEQPRTVTGEVAPIGEALARESGLALVGSRDERDIYLLESTGGLTAIGANGQKAIPVVGAAGGLVIPAPNAPSGINSFALLQDSGALVEIFAQPFYDIRGIAGDGAGAVLWLETPQAGLDQWQLWEYRVESGELHLLAQESLGVFGSKDNPILPSLVAAIPGEAGGWWYLMETAKPQNQQNNTGFFQLNLTSGGRVDEVRLLIPEGTYRAPLQVSPDGKRLAYLAYDPNQPSLTAGFVQPSNRLWVRPVGDLAFGNDSQLAAYATENRFEFLTPGLAWRDDQRILLSRSRFSTVGVFALDIFGITEVNLSGQKPVSVSHLLRVGSAIKDSAVCQDDRRIALSLVDEAGVYRLAEWTGDGKPLALADLPLRVDRIFACWHLPDAPFSVNQP